NVQTRRWFSTAFDLPSTSQRGVPSISPYTLSGVGSWKMALGPPPSNAGLRVGGRWKPLEARSPPAGRCVGAARAGAAVALPTSGPFGRPAGNESRELSRGTLAEDECSTFLP